MTPLVYTIGRNVEAMRKDQGYGRHAFAKHSGVCVDILRKLERGDGDPRLSTLEKLAAALCCPVGDLLKRRD